MLWLMDISGLLRVSLNRLIAGKPSGILISGYMEIP
jgi:hypothetical protein